MVESSLGLGLALGVLLQFGTVALAEAPASSMTTTSVLAAGARVSGRPSIVAANAVSPTGVEAGATAAVTLALVGNPALGPYSVRMTPGSGAAVSRVQFDVDGRYWSTDTVSPFYLFRHDGRAPVLGTLGAGGHQVLTQVFDAKGAKIGDGELVFWEGPPPPVPPVSPMFPASNVWNTPVDGAPLHALHSRWMDLINGHTGHNLHPEFGTTYRGRYNGIPLNVVAGSSVPRVSVALTAYAAESDAIPSNGLPVPAAVLVEGDPGPFDPEGDNHGLIVDTETHSLHEFFGMQRNGDGSYTAKQYSRWDYTSNALRPDGWTSADAAGLPIAPLLVRYDEVQAAVASGGSVPHALRFTVALTSRGPLWPARHEAPSGGALNPPMGMWVRLKRDFDISGYSATNQAILRTLKTHGMILADNGGDWLITGVPDPRWDDNDLGLLKQIVPHQAFEVVDVSAWMVRPDSAEARPR